MDEQTVICHNAAEAMARKVIVAADMEPDMRSIYFSDFFTNEYDELGGSE